MKIILKFVIILSLNLGLSAQIIDRQVIATAGNSVSNTNHKLAFTIGESLIGEIRNSNIINQGFLATASSSSTLGIDEQLLSSALKVYPNPVKENLSIDLTNALGKTKIIIYNTNGQLVKNQMLSQLKNTLNLGNLQSGVYLVNLLFSDFKAVKSFKIIKN